MIFLHAVALWFVSMVVVFGAVLWARSIYSTLRQARIDRAAMQDFRQEWRNLADRLDKAMQEVESARRHSDAWQAQYYATKRAYEQAVKGRTN